MNQTTKETRRRSYDAVLPKRAARCRLILETLGNRELTASEITEELVAAGRIPYFNRNYVAPRLTELKEIGILTTVGRRKATRSDATEAVFAAVYLDGGITAASELIHRVLLDVEREEVVEERRRDYKTLLQERVQRQAGQELTYCMVREEGPDHAKTFVTEVQLNGAAIGEGSGHSKKESEQMAAKSALEKLDDQ